MNLFGQGITSFSFIGIISNAKAKDISFFWGGGESVFLLYFFFSFFIYSDYFKKSRFLFICLFVVK